MTICEQRFYKYSTNIVLYRVPDYLKYNFRSLYSYRANILRTKFRTLFFYKIITERQNGFIIASLYNSILDFNCTPIKAIYES